MRKTILFIVLLALTACACEHGNGAANRLTDLPEPSRQPNEARANTPPGTKDSAVELHPESYADLFVIKVDGSGCSRLVSEYWTQNPTWSPDGSKIAFAMAPDHGALWYHYVINAAGGKSVRLVRAVHAFESRSVWSPDGTRIAAPGYRQGTYKDHPAKCPVLGGDGTFGRNDICIVAVDGARKTWLAGFGDDHSPSWSPDGTKVAFAARKYRDGKGAFYIQEADGSGAAQPAEGVGDPYARGLRDKHAAALVVKGNDIFTARKGGKTTRLTRTGDIGEAVLSPDGSTIAFTRIVKDEWEVSHLWTMNADGTRQIRLTRGTFWTEHPAWSPDGARIAFVAGFHRPPEIPDPKDLL